MVDQIVHIYENVMPKQKIMLAHDEAIAYFERLMMNGNIITYVKDGELLGFLEFWKISTEQFGRICANLPIDHSEDILSGNIALISRMYIVPDLRNGETFLFLGREFLRCTNNCIRFGWLQFHKKHKPLQIYNREDLFKQHRMEK